MDPNDRSAWPPSEANPLVALLRGGAEWIDNQALAEALDPANAARRRSLIGHWPDAEAMLGTETAMRQGTMLVPWKRQGGRGVRRVYSRKAAVLIALRAQTSNAAAFRYWLAGLIAERPDLLP